MNLTSRTGAALVNSLGEPVSRTRDELEQLRRRQEEVENLQHMGEGESEQLHTAASPGKPTQHTTG